MKMDNVRADGHGGGSDGGSGNGLDLLNVSTERNASPSQFLELISS